MRAHENPDSCVRLRMLNSATDGAESLRSETTQPTAKSQSLLEGSLLPSHKLYGGLDQDSGLKHRHEEAEALELTVSWDLRRTSS